MPSSTRPAKIAVLVYAFHTPDEGGGFNWAPDDAENRGLLLDALAFDLAHANYTTGTLVSLKVPALTTSMVTDLLEGELQDAIEVGAVGHIIARYYRSA